MFRRPLTRVLPAAVFILLCLFLYYSFSFKPVPPRSQSQPQSQSQPDRHRDFPYQPSSFDWANFTFRYPRDEADVAQLPQGQPRKLPRVQHAFSKTEMASGAQVMLKERRNAVLKAFTKSWDSYKKYAWKYDELMPLSGSHKNTFGGLRATLVDALDTLWIMGLKNDFYEAVRAVAALDFNNTRDSSLNLFETVIRYLGGLLAAYDLSGEPVLLKKAVDLGDMLYVAFDTPNHLPGFWFDFAKAKAGSQIAGTFDASAGPCSLSLEFTRLAQLTGDSKYYEAIDKVTKFLERTQNVTYLPGMWPRQINFQSETVLDNDFTLGALADSLYEYLPKMYALLGGLEPRYEKLYRGAIEAAEKHMLFRPMTPDNADILFTGEVNVHLKSVSLKPESQHLSCFTGGMFGLGGKLFGIDRHVEIGEKLARGCGWGYTTSAKGLLPEIFGLVMCDSITECKWDEEKWKKEGTERLPRGFSHARDPRYILRPEAIESVFLLYRMTGKTELQDLAWEMFEAIQKATETKYGFAAVVDVTQKGELQLTDSMESFWLAETLKYFYLIFSPTDVISLDEYVFNTEAHPFKRP